MKAFVLDQLTMVKVDILERIKLWIYHESFHSYENAAKSNTKNSYVWMIWYAYSKSNLDEGWLKSEFKKTYYSPMSSM
jgi:hypothetical protein